ncbi:eCIS core domain-containing protein [Streptomyces sp. IBSNAI002]|uniref:eCIS core domain-containing protein n=1 Tax=Streptomyces sp. IBSNAI002 TaxID=3457500 RepID=UPI003FD6511A
MRERENNETAEAKAAHRAQRERSGGGLPQQRLLAMQGASGNAAVVQLLRRSGHRGARQEHRHGPGCGHDQQERVTVQRSAVHDVLRSGGRPLDDTTRTDMEARLGADFSDVRVHDDAAARASAAAVGARAYTSGSHVVIGDGGADRHTLAHELTHVIQQRRGPVAGTDNGDGLRVSDPSDRFEREAEATATRVTSGPPPLHTTAPAPAERHAMPASPPEAVQRTVTMKGAQVDDPARLIQESDLDHLLEPTGRRVLAYLKDSRANAALEVNDPEELLIEVGRIAAMIDLVHSINTRGILGRRTLVDQGIAHTGSNDRGDSTALAVNVLDTRGAQNPDLARIQEVVTKSLTEPNNGSFSVAMERPQDDDVILDEMAGDLDAITLPEADLAGIRKAAQGDESLARILTSAMKRERLSDDQGATVAQYVSLLQERTQNTAMAIVNRPGPDVATLSPGVTSYESDVPSDRIRPGEGGFTSLVLPAWFEPYGLLLMMQEWPEGVALRFAGTKAITAHYRAKGTDWPVTVEAPDYGAEIQSQLQQFKVIATHILKISSL